MRRNRDFGSKRGTSERAAKTQEQLRTLAWLLDSSIRLPGGFRIGIDPLLGLIPFLGDAAGVLLSGYIVTQAARLGVPRSVLMRMILNVAVEGVIGLIPLVGDVFDAAWKANQRNVRLLERHLNDPAEAVRSSRLFVGAAIALVIVLMVLMSVLSALVLSALWRAITG